MEASGQYSRAHFPTTHWSVVVNTAGDSTNSRPALEELCRAYWPPIYAELRRRGYSPTDAQDLTQEFFLRLLERETFSAADRERGRFRTFLLSALDFTISDHWRTQRAAKRGGGVKPLSLDEGECEAWFREEPAAGGDAAAAFDRRWAVVIMDRALAALRAEYGAGGRGEVFDAVNPFLSAEAGEGGYEAACGSIGLSAQAFAVAVHRFRKRFRECVREQVAMTVADPGEVDAEMKHLFGVKGAK